MARRRTGGSGEAWQEKGSSWLDTDGQRDGGWICCPSRAGPEDDTGTGALWMRPRHSEPSARHGDGPGGISTEVWGCFRGTQTLRARGDGTGHRLWESGCPEALGDEGRHQGAGQEPGLEPPGLFQWGAGSQVRCPRRSSSPSGTDSKLLLSMGLGTAWWPLTPLARRRRLRIPVLSCICLAQVSEQLRRHPEVRLTPLGRSCAVSTLPALLPGKLDRVPPAALSGHWLNCQVRPRIWRGPRETDEPGRATPGAQRRPTVHG